MDKYVTQIKLILIVFGELYNPEELTKTLRIEPTNFWKKGDEIKSNLSFRKKNRPLPVRKESGWEYSFGFRDTLDFHEVSTTFESTFSSRAKLLRDFIEKNDLEITINIIVEIANNQVPSLNFNHKFLSLVYDLNAEIDIDTYLLDDE